MLEVSDISLKVEGILNANEEGMLFKIFTDAGELEQDEGFIRGTENYICGVLELFNNTLSGEGLKFQDLTFQITWFVDSRKIKIGNKKIAGKTESVRKILTTFAEAYNNKNFPSENFNGDFYSSTYFVRMPTNQTEIKNFSYMSNCIPMTQIIELLLIENGVSSNQWVIKANNETLVYQTLSISNEKQASHSIIANEKRTKGIIQSNGLCFDTVIQQLKTDFCNLVEKDILDHQEDKALCVYAKGNNTTNIYICVLGNDSVSLQKGTNAGINLALVEGVEDLLNYDDDWVIEEITTTEENEQITATAVGHIFWGDGEKTISSNGSVTHTYEVPGDYIIRCYGTFTIQEEE